MHIDDNLLVYFPFPCSPDVHFLVSLSASSEKDETARLKKQLADVVGPKL